MCDKMAIYAYILKIVEKDPLLRLQMSAKEMFNRHQFFPTHKQYLKIKLMHTFFIISINISPLLKEILHRFVSFCISPISTYCFLEENKLVTIKHSIALI